MASSVIEETQMCRLIGKRSQSASCHETKEGPEEEKHSVFTLACCFGASMLPVFPSLKTGRAGLVEADRKY